MGYYDMYYGDWDEFDEEIRLGKISKNRDKLINELLGIEEPVTDEEFIEQIVEKGLLSKIRNILNSVISI